VDSLLAVIGLWFASTLVVGVTLGILLRRTGIAADDPALGAPAVHTTQAQSPAPAPAMVVPRRPSSLAGVSSV
jgi:hypothetical protein